MSKGPMDTFTEMLCNAVAIDRSGNPMLDVTGFERHPDKIVVTFQDAPADMVIVGLASRDGTVLVQFAPRAVIKGDTAVLDLKFSQD